MGVLLARNEASTVCLDCDKRHFQIIKADNNFFRCICVHVHSTISFLKVHNFYCCLLRSQLDSSKISHNVDRINFIDQMHLDCVWYPVLSKFQMEGDGLWDSSLWLLVVSILIGVDISLLKQLVATYDFRRLLLYHWCMTSILNLALSTFMLWNHIFWLATYNS